VVQCETHKGDPSFPGRKFEILRRFFHFYHETGQDMHKNAISDFAKSRDQSLLFGTKNEKKFEYVSS